MERPGIEEEETNDPKLVETSPFQELHQLFFKNLEHEWNFIKKRPETGSSKMGKTTLEGVLLEYNSQRKLMSSLQHRTMSPPSMEEAVAWKVRTNDLAVEEILNERRAAIESGKLRGRRLFEEEEGVNEVIYNGLQEIGLVQESEVRSVFSYEHSDNYEEENWGRKEALSPSCPHCSYSSSSSSSLWAESVERSGGLEVATLEEKRNNNIACDVGSGRRRWLVMIKIWVAISLVVCIVGIIISWNCFGLYEDEEVILTPT
ncbi:hypothetical protein PTKIN_Ptkin05aG0203300 [Pterospermum kingtungense]